MFVCQGDIGEDEVDTPRLRDSVIINSVVMTVCSCSGSVSSPRDGTKRFTFFSPGDRFNQTPSRRLWADSATP